MKHELIKRIISSLVLIPLALFFIINGSFLFNFFILVCFLISSYEWHNISKKKSYYFFGYIFLFISFYTVYSLRHFPDSNDGLLIFLFITLICVSTDIGGYLFGKLFKGPKLTKLSPNKTYSGVMGGYFLTIIFSLIYLNQLNYNIDNYTLIIMKFFFEDLIFVILISTFSQIGDLIISYFKRLSNIKDTGKIIPGHGGLLDRIDGMIFAFPIGFLVYNFF